MIAQSFVRRGEVPRIVHEVFDDVQPAAMAAALDGFCDRVLGARLESCEFFDAGVGSVHGLRLRDGRRVVVKVQLRECLRRSCWPYRQCSATYLSAASPHPSHSLPRLGLAGASRWSRR